MRGCMRGCIIRYVPPQEARDAKLLLWATLRVQANFRGYQVGKYLIIQRLIQLLIQTPM